MSPWYHDTYTGKIYPGWYGYYTNTLLASSAVTQGYAGFDNWLGQPTMARWKAAVSRAPSIETGQRWGMWLIGETLANPPESPTSYGFVYQCEGLTSEYWTSTPYSISGSVYNVASLMRDQFFTSIAGGVKQDINYPVRTLKPGEQYFWYQ